MRHFPSRGTSYKLDFGSLGQGNLVLLEMVRCTCREGASTEFDVQMSIPMGRKMNANRIVHNTKPVFQLRTAASYSDKPRNMKMIISLTVLSSAMSEQ